jgi:ATP-binding cassette subfamily B protein
MKMLKLMKGLRQYLLLMVIFSIAQVACELYLPSIMSKVVDVGISSSNVDYIFSESFKMIIIAVVGLTSNILVVYAASKFSNQYGYNIRKALYNKINSFSKREIDKFGASTLITRSTNNVSNITSTFSFGLRLILFAPIMGFGAALMGYKTSPALAPIVLCAVSILMIGVIIIFSFVYKKFEILQYERGAKEC